MIPYHSTSSSNWNQRKKVSSLNAEWIQRNPPLRKIALMNSKVSIICSSRLVLKLLPCFNDCLIDVVIFSWKSISSVTWLLLNFHIQLTIPEIILKGLYSSKCACLLGYLYIVVAKYSNQKILLKVVKENYLHALNDNVEAYKWNFPESRVFISNYSEFQFLICISL